MKRLASFIKKATQSLLARTENDRALHRTRRQFLPAALEVEDTPAHPASRAIAVSISLLFVIALVWACVGKIDIVAVAQGKIIPGDRVKTIQPMELGKVTAIHVREGEMVSQGSPLVTLDGTVTAAELERLRQEKTALGLQLARQQTFIQTLNSPKPASTASLSDDIAAKQTAIRFEEQLLNQQLAEYTTTLQTLTSQKAAKTGEWEMLQALVNKLKRTLPIVEERAKALETLYKKNMVARTQFLEIEQLRIEQEEDLKAQQAQMRQLQAEIEEITHQQSSLTARVRKESLTEQEQLKRQIDALTQELVKAEQRHKQQVLTAPIDGTVQQLQVHTIGGVVQPAQPLMQIVPKDAKVEVEAWILNKDIGFVTEGQEAEVKIDTFNFTKYGIIDGLLKHISDDAVPDEKLGLRYMASVQIEKDWMQVDKRVVSLSPGMNVAVEVKIGQRRLIEYFLSPLLRFKQESIRER
ncbi:MAG: HlyD family type I secretion periplasmic adaptor subunit [Endozoicomonas sp.]